MKAVLFGAAVLAAAAVGEAHAKGAPPGWREATRADVEAVAARLGSKPEDRVPQQALKVSGDFDGDGRPDRARVLIDQRQRRLGVFVTRGAGGPPQMLHATRLDSLVSVTLSVEPPGAYPTACSRGLGDDEAPCKPVVKSRHPLLMLTFFEASDTVFQWNGKRFVGTALTD